MKENHSSNDVHTKNGQPYEPADNHPSESMEVPASDQSNDATQASPHADGGLASNGQQTFEKVQAALATTHDKYIRLYAEFDNYRKRTIQERIALIETAGEKLLQQFLPILDDFERALAALRQDNISIEDVEKGLQLIYDKMIHFLEQAGVQHMPVEQGSVFNTELHEAITKAPTTDPALHNKVIDVIEKGYMLKDKVLRHAKIIIGE